MLPQGAANRTEQSSRLLTPVVWRSRWTPRRTQEPVYGVELAATVAMRICVVPDYSRAGSFLINDLAYLAPADFLQIVQEGSALPTECYGGRIDT